MSAMTEFLTGQSSVRQVLQATGEDFPTIPLSEFILDLNSTDLSSLIRGNLSFLVHIHPRVQDNIRNMQAQGASVDLVSLVPEFSEFSFRRSYLGSLELPQSYDFDVYFRQWASEAYDRLVSIVLHYDGKEFIRRLAQETTHVGELVDRLATTLPQGEAQILDLLMQGNSSPIVLMAKPLLSKHISSFRQTYLTQQSHIEHLRADQSSPQSFVNFAESGLFGEVVAAAFYEHAVVLPDAVPSSLLQAHQTDLETHLRLRAEGDPGFSSETFPALDRALSKP
jgi:hypothetical protein